MNDENGIFLGGSHQVKENIIKPEYIWLKYANRHGLITGATGTGKTVTLQVLAESFSQAGVPVFCADIKGDLSGVSLAGTMNDKIKSRAEDVGLGKIVMQANPVVFWDLFGEQGHPIRTTVTEMGPLLLSQLLELTPAQEGVLNIAFRVAQDEKMLLLDLKDLQSMLSNLGERASEFSNRYGNVSKASVGSIQRQLLVLEQQGASHFFGEPALRLPDIMRTTTDGRGIINILAAEKLMVNPRLYSTFLMWLMSELFEQLPEIGDPEKPKLVFFFDEAHLLFNNAPKALLERIEQVVRLIRSKGVGIYFISQNPLDVPDKVLAQLGNRVQHALRAYTPRETAAVKAASATFRANPAFDTMTAIGQLSTGEALISTLQEKGIPSIVERTMIRPPASQIGPITFQQREQFIKTSPLAGVYDEVVDRQSAYEILAEKMNDRLEKKTTDAKSDGGIMDTIFGTSKTSKGRQTVAEAAMKSVTRSAANSIGRALAKMGTDVLKRILANLLRGGRK